MPLAAIDDIIDNPIFYCKRFPNYGSLFSIHLRFTRHIINNIKVLGDANNEAAATGATYGLPLRAAPASSLFCGGQPGTRKAKLS
jgi:hypothetical protein